MVRSPAWSGDHPITAGKYYSSGAYHGSWDVGMPIGTDVFAPVDGTILALNEGVSNTPVRRSGAPSNWILLGFMWKGARYTYFFQHLSPSIPVVKGQKVRKGQKIADSGNSGNSSGPHLHITLQPGYQTAATRYEYLTKKDGVVPPSQGWVWPSVDTSAIAYAATKDPDSYPYGTKLVQKALAATVGLDYSSGYGIYGPRTKAAYAVWEKTRGFTTNGIPDLASLNALGKQSGFFYAVV